MGRDTSRLASAVLRFHAAAPSTRTILSAASARAPGMGVVPVPSGAPMGAGEGEAAVGSVEAEGGDVENVETKKKKKEETSETVGVDKGDGASQGGVGLRERSDASSTYLPPPGLLP